MEEYRDLALITDAVQRALGDGELGDLDAGIVLQAYLPDSAATLDALCLWADERRRRWGGRFKVRLVKGANLAMERVEADLQGWDPAPLPTKAAVDAAYKRLLEVALDARWRDAVRVGVASHNLFELAWALETAHDLGAADRLDLELLTGMADAQAVALRQAGSRVLLYTPVVRSDDRTAAIAYLVRRLDENTSPENFLRHIFTLAPGSATWHDQESRFRDAVTARHADAPSSRRQQDRGQAPAPRSLDAPFANEPDTDWTSAANRKWLAEHLASWTPPPDGADDTEVDVDAVVGRGRAAGPAWAGRSHAARRAILLAAAEVMAAERGTTIAALAHATGKVPREADPEVSEAIDFARWYAAATRQLEQLEADGLQAEPPGLVVVTSPWNFPYAIAAGGVLAALAGGSPVVLKPAPQARAVGRLVAEHLWSAGVPRDVLQLLVCEDEPHGQALVTHPGVDVIVLTGSHDTAMRFLDWRPRVRLGAETSGKNALVITDAADLDDAIRDLVRSAFGHAGQKCSAASLAIVTADLYDDPAFRRRLADATRSLRVGPATDPASAVGPLIEPPAGRLADALTRLDPGETWLVEPVCRGEDGRLWSPGVKLGVRPGSAFHLQEYFGPVLGVMRADDLEHAIALQNATPYGLTGGIHSLDHGEVRQWLERVEVGNAYVNRTITGAIVGRQPFGGWKRSSVGGSGKAGGPDHVPSLLRWTAVGPPVSLAEVGRRFRLAWASTYGQEVDRTGLWCERNVLRYRPLAGPVVLRIGADTPGHDVSVARAAAAVTGASLQVSSPVARADMEGVVVESDVVLGARLEGCSRLRHLADVDDSLLRAAHRAGVVVDDQPVLGHPTVELPRWLRAQAVSTTTHRHGTPVTSW
jgi:RHH-type proline utilization regulon transcriptional repressor/proline dehydrogenase/delta 1-pyrroline-5-carboxylate dehydrogenase